MVKMYNVAVVSNAAAEAFGRLRIGSFFDETNYETFNKLHTVKNSPLTLTSSSI